LEGREMGVRGWGVGGGDLRLIMEGLCCAPTSSTAASTLSLPCFTLSITAMSSDEESVSSLARRRAASSEAIRARREICHTERGVIEGERDESAREREREEEAYGKRGVEC
jgi:hypothetical protein